VESEQQVSTGARFFRGGGGGMMEDGKKKREFVRAFVLLKNVFQ
jgi:hypothetical protein